MVARLVALVLLLPLIALVPASRAGATCPQAVQVVESCEFQVGTGFPKEMSVLAKGLCVVANPGSPDPYAMVVVTLDNCGILP